MHFNYLKFLQLRSVVVDVVVFVVCRHTVFLVAVRVDWYSKNSVCLSYHVLGDAIVVHGYVVRCNL